MLNLLKHFSFPTNLREASRVLGFSITKIWFILRKVLKWRAYTPFVSACLTQSNVEKQLNSAKWFLSHDSKFFEEKVIWSDEKYFVVNQGPNKSINKTWDPVNPYLNVECKTQSQKKIMCWVGLYNDASLVHFGVIQRWTNRFIMIS